VNEMQLFARLTVQSPLVFPKYLKWKDEIVADISETLDLTFRGSIQPYVVSLVSENKKIWDKPMLMEFLKDRLPSPDRRDIEELLSQVGLVQYDLLRLATKTRAFNPKDLFWLAMSSDEKFEDVMPDILKEIFLNKKDIEGHNVVSPEGLNQKRYGVYKRKYGILKKRLYPTSTDVESEIAVYELAKLLGVPCCPAHRVVDGTTVMSFSEFKYNFAEEFIVHFSRFMEAKDMGGDRRKVLLNKFPEFGDDIDKMILLDFITRQDDRHTSNFALKVSKGEVEFYSLYDNGRSLFYEDTEQTVSDALDDLNSGSTPFGQVGSYYDFAVDIAKEKSISSLINLNIEKDTLFDVYFSAGIEGYRLHGAVEWSWKCIQFLKTL
jgi:hypothetical protein